METTVTTEASQTPLPNVVLSGEKDPYVVPKTCKAGVVKEFGPDFKLVVEDVPVPEPGKLLILSKFHFLRLTVSLKVLTKYSCDLMQQEFVTLICITCWKICRYLG